MKLQLGIDYYLDSGKVVLSREYLLRRGYCCNGQCRHCPYRLQEEQDMIDLSIDFGQGQITGEVVGEGNDMVKELEEAGTVIKVDQLSIKVGE